MSSFGRPVFREDVTVVGINCHHSSCSATQYDVHHMGGEEGRGGKDAGYRMYTWYVFFVFIWLLLCL